MFFILRHLTNLRGLDFVADLLLHYVMPALFVIDWVFFVPKVDLRMSAMFGWLGYPVAYLAWTFVHGALTGFYPYPFLNTDALGVGRLLVNELGLLLLFLVLAMVMISLGRREVISRLPPR